MKKTKKKKFAIIIVLSIIAVILLVAALYYFVADENNYSFAEKKWINDNLNNVIDIQLESDLPIFSLGGKGVYFDYIRALEADTGISFNIIHAESNNNTFKTSKEINKNDLIFLKDHYVIVSKNGSDIGSLNDLKNNTIGVITDDMSYISYYLTDYSSITYKTYGSIEDMNAGLESGNILLAIIPLYKYVDHILEANLNIDYHLDGLYSYYNLAVNEKNVELNSIMKKFLKRWNNELESKIGSYFLELYYDINDFSEISKESIVNDDYLVGYIESLPFDGRINRHFSGLNNTYLSAFTDLTGATYKYIEYKSVENMVDDLNEKKIDIAYNPYAISNPNYAASINLGTTDYVILAHQNSALVVNSMHSLKNSTITMLDKMNLLNNFKNEKLFKIETFANTNDLFNSIDENSIILIEKIFYDYYKDSELKDYSIRFSNKINLNNTYLLKNENTAFNQLFNFFLTTLSHQEMEAKGLSNSIQALHSNVVSTFLINNAVYVFITASIVAIILYRLSKKMYISKRIKKEDRMLYMDVMTNLKNRNYLNDNIDYWEKNRVYPQAIVILDLNKIKELNDQKGHEEGDKQIRAAACALIKTQRENSEIMRTDGNEFMVYLVGYDEKVITSYLHKLNRELKSTLPYENYGVAIGYSMITDELKTIDDAINEASIMMRGNKETRVEK